MRHDEFYAFAFRGLLANASLDRAGCKMVSGFSEAEEAEIARRLGISGLDEEFVTRARKMAIVYVAICAFENTVRYFVSKKLLEVAGEGWWEACVKKEIRDKAESRKKSEKDVRWLTARGDSMIHYTEFGDLISIIAKPENWAHFEVHIGKVEWAKQIIETLEKSRNIIMHSGELGSTDIERVGMYIRDWINQVGG